MSIAKNRWSESETHAYKKICVNILLIEEWIFSWLNNLNSVHVCVRQYFTRNAKCLYFFLGGIAERFWRTNASQIVPQHQGLVVVAVMDDVDNIWRENFEWKSFASISTERQMGGQKRETPHGKQFRPLSPRYVLHPPPPIPFLLVSPLEIPRISLSWPQKPLSEGPEKWFPTGHPREFLLFATFCPSL